MSKLTAYKLKEELWDTLESLKSGKKTVEEAVAISGVAREIVRATNTQIKISAHSARPLPTEVLDFSEKAE